MCLSTDKGTLDLKHIEKNFLKLYNVQEQVKGVDNMPDLNDFYAFKMTTGGSSSGGGRNNSSGNGGNSGCATALIVLAIIGWVLCFIGKS